MSDEPQTRATRGRARMRAHGVREMMSGGRFHPDDAVRVVRVLVSEREVTGSSATPPQPRVGDMGTVVADVGDGLYLVESCTADGMTIWMTELAAEELALVDRTGGSF